MTRVKIDQEVAAPISKVWELVSDFGGIARISPDVQSCEVSGEGVGAVRRIVSSGFTVEERLESLDAAQHVLSYSMLEGPIPFRDYVATVKLSEAGPDRTRIRWSGTFEPAGMPEEQLRQLIESVYRGLIAGIEKAAAA